MALRVVLSPTSPLLTSNHLNLYRTQRFQYSILKISTRTTTLKTFSHRQRISTICAALPSLDLTEDNIRQVLIDARSEFAQIFDESAGMTGKADLAELDGPFVKLSLKGRFWHERSMVLARLSNYLKIRIPEILEVDIEDERQLDDSPENF